jgi:hypothetical protein
MKNTEKQAIDKLNNILQNLPPRSPLAQEIKDNVQILVQELNNLDQEVKQKEQLLVQKEKELVRLKSITDNSSKVARDIINESKGNLDQATSLYKSGKFSEALKYSDIALYNIGDINSFGIKTVEQANKLYVERLELYKESSTKRDYLYNRSVVNGVNAFGWVKSNPKRDFYTFFRETLNIPDKEQKSPDNVRIIKKLYKLLPLYVKEAQRTNYFYNENNKYHDVLLKLQQVINIYNIKAASSKGLKDYEDALKTCDIALEIDPKNLTLSNLKNAILQEKQAIEDKKVKEEQLLVSQTQEIEKLKEILALKEVETQEKNKLLTQKGNELATTEKVLIDKHQKETEVLKTLLAQKELEHQELLTKKDKEVKELEKVKNGGLIRELLDILPQAYPGSGYNKPFTEWDTSSWGKKVIDAGNFKEMERYLPELREKAVKFKEENLEKQAKELENAKRLQEENLKKEELLGNKEKLLSDKEQEIAKFKELLSIKEIETEKLLAQKEKEIQNKSLFKNQLINELQKDVGLKEKETLNLKIELLMKQLAFKEKEVELKDKALEDALEIGKQKDIVNELQGKLLAFKNLNKDDETLQFELSVIHFKVEESILGGNVEEMKELSKYFSELMKNPIEKEESLDISELLNNLSPIVHEVDNQVQNPLAVINNFDINHINTTHSVYPSGEGSSFDIIQEESLN